MYVCVDKPIVMGTSVYTQDLWGRLELWGNFWVPTKKIGL